MNFDRPPKFERDVTDALTPLLDDALVKDRKAKYAAGRGSGAGDVAGKRIGAGYIGTECDRALAYRYHKAPKEDRVSSVSPGELQRHAESGHWTESAMAGWLQLSGFDIRTEKGDGRQYGYQVARHPETGQAQIAGEIDGVILSGPADLPYPVLWESKKATHKKATKFRKEGVAKADKKYFGQIQTNMAYLEVGNTLFSMLDLDTMEFYHELVTFDPKIAQKLTDRAVSVLQSEHAEEFARIGKDATDFKCKFCDYAGQCWNSPAPQVNERPPWLPMSTNG